MANARAKAEQADLAAEKAQQDSDVARLKAKEYAPEFHQPGNDWLDRCARAWYMPEQVLQWPAHDRVDDKSEAGVRWEMYFQHRS